MNSRAPVSPIPGLRIQLGLEIGSVRLVPYDAGWPAVAQWRPLATADLARSKRLGLGVRVSVILRI